MLQSTRQQLSHRTFKNRRNKIKKIKKKSISIQIHSNLTNRRLCNNNNNKNSKKEEKSLYVYMPKGCCSTHKSSMSIISILAYGNSRDSA